jgi:hypothetical protein
VSDDWRVTATFHEDGAARVLERLHELVVEKDARKLLGSHVAVSVDGDNVFLYADTRESAREAERIVREILEREGLSAYVKLDHWHQLAEEWEDQSVPLPSTSIARTKRPRTRRRPGSLPGRFAWSAPHAATPWSSRDS